MLILETCGNINLRRCNFNPPTEKCSRPKNVCREVSACEGSTKQEDIKCSETGLMNSAINTYEIGNETPVFVFLFKSP
jgi:hypothetical protein